MPVLTHRKHTQIRVSICYVNMYTLIIFKVNYNSHSFTLSHVIWVVSILSVYKYILFEWSLITTIIYTYFPEFIVYENSQI